MNLEQAKQVTRVFIEATGGPPTASRMYHGLVLALDEPELAARLRSALEATIPGLVLDCVVGQPLVVVALRELLDGMEEQT